MRKLRFVPGGAKTSAERMASFLSNPLTIECVSKNYGDQAALRDVTISCAQGTVTALVGPNGAGKSTLMRIALGLARPTSGKALLFDTPIQDAKPPVRDVAALLSPTLHPGRTVTETAELHRRLVGLSRAARDAALESSGISHAGRKRCGTLSTGMRQRLCLALVMMGSPRLLILDEPTNGLDAEGSVWLREQLIAYAGSGGCVLISSHLLNDLEKFIDAVVFLKNGVVTAAGDWLELRRVTNRPLTRVIVAQQDADRLIRALAGQGIEFDCASGRQGSLTVAAPSRTCWRLLVSESIEPLEMSDQSSNLDLEDFFLSQLSSEESPGGDAGEVERP
ncbi:MAG: ATP-binding cassette domain-containing protein [Bifidobacteriaceae bacterium]|jgi:ABC-2 type transport system ATP-binding protein|nr:ATP-binding cassette domain-containing protein [Bifidobacteriaceae bacterium]